MLGFGTLEIIQAREIIDLIQTSKLFWIKIKQNKEIQTDSSKIQSISSKYKHLEIK